MFVHTVLIHTVLVATAFSQFAQPVVMVSDGLTTSESPRKETDGTSRKPTIEVEIREILPPTTDRLTLADVMASLYRSHPKIEQARLESGVAAGQRRTALGEWDPKLEANSLSQPVGFYENHRNSLGLARNLWWGGYLATGYRIGRGSFEPWYKERETDKGGEFAISWVQPLLQGRAIDPQRVALFQSNLRQQAVAPNLQAEILENGRQAANAYWSWVATGNTVRVQEDLLRLAQVRVKQVEKLVEAGGAKQIDLLLNQTLIASRQFKLTENVRKFNDAGFKLSLYLRNEDGQPMVPRYVWLPERFPSIPPLPDGDFSSDYAAALSRRPELVSIQLQIQQYQWDYQLANNQRLPEFGVVWESSQDTGEPASSLRDKSPFEMEIGLMGSVPLPRNKALGKMQSTRAKIAQLVQKQELVCNNIGVDLQMARNALETAAQRVAQAQTLVRIELEYLAAAQKGYANGIFDLLQLNIFETKAYEARFGLNDTLGEWYSALAQMQYALGLDPLEEALQISELIESMTVDDALPTTVAPKVDRTDPKAKPPDSKP